MSLYDYLKESIPQDHCRQVSSSGLLKAYASKGITPERTLDFGCGAGESSGFIQNALPDTHWVGVDIASSPEVDARKATDRHIVTYDGYSLPFSNNYFDLVYSHQVLEHVRKPELALSEIGRVLTSTGLFIGQTSQFEPYHSYSLWNFTIYGFKKMVEDSGMKLLEFRPAIDGFTLMKRSYEGNAAQYNKYFSEESPKNREIEEKAKGEKLSNGVINFRKLIYSGQFCFVCCRK